MFVWWLDAVFWSATSCDPSFFRSLLIHFFYFSPPSESVWGHTASSHRGSWRSRRSSTATSLQKTWETWARSAVGRMAPSTTWCTSPLARLWLWRWAGDRHNTTSTNTGANAAILLLQLDHISSHDEGKCVLNICELWIRIIWNDLLAADKMWKAGKLSKLRGLNTSIPVCHRREENCGRVCKRTTSGIKGPLAQIFKAQQCDSYWSGGVRPSLYVYLYHFLKKNN